MTTIYEITKDNDVIKEVKTVEKLIDLKVLQAEIDMLTEQVEDMPDEMMVPSGKAEMINDLVEKQKYIDELKKVK